MGKINNKEVGFLLHNFVDPMMVERLQLNGLNVDSFEVTVARGENMASVHCCRGVKLNIQGQESEANLLVIPLGDAQIILGTVWLRSLEPTIWDFSNHTLKVLTRGDAYYIKGGETWCSGDD